MNPVSVMACLSNGRFGNYWCPTHSLEIVTGKLLADGKTPDYFEDFDVHETSLYERNPIHNNIPTSVYMLLFGYLTIKEYNKQSKTVILGYPNEEIKEVLTNNFNLYLMTEHPAELGKNADDVRNCLKRKNMPAHFSFSDSF